MRIASEPQADPILAGPYLAGRQPLDSIGGNKIAMRRASSNILASKPHTRARPSSAYALRHDRVTEFWADVAKGVDP
jgi:hypothetical protein